MSYTRIVNAMKNAQDDAEVLKNRADAISKRIIEHVQDALANEFGTQADEVDQAMDELAILLRAAQMVTRRFKTEDQQDKVARIWAEVTNHVLESTGAGRRSIEHVMRMLGLVDEDENETKH